MTLTEKQFSEIAVLLQQIVRGTHDPQPTRCLPPIANDVAWEIDRWWQDYYASNEKSLKILAKQALNVMYSDDARGPDPCPGCQKGTVCRTPACGRLKWNKS